MSMSKAQDHPFPARVSHWINLISFAVLGVTGLIIHTPTLVGNLNVVRNLHFLFIYVLVINGLFRIYYSLVGKNKDYKEFLFNGKDFKNLPGILRYYMFLGPHPETGKYNPLQKGAYLGLFLFTGLQALCGLAIWLPEKYQGLAAWFGGAASARGLHYFLAWVFLAIIITHIYLAFKETFSAVKLMFFGIVDEKK